MKTNRKLEVLVIGSTGRQGGAVARELLARGHRVRAYTRKPHSPAAGALAALGAEIMTGDLSDPVCVESAAAGVDAIFSVGSWREAGLDVEVKHGITAANAAKKMSTPHFVYSSVAGANLGTGIPHFESKRCVEEHIASLDLPSTISAPVSFMENIMSPAGLDALRQGRLPGSLPPSRKVQLIAVRDIGAFVVSLLERREDVLGRRFDIAGDELSGEDQAAILSGILGRKIQFQPVPLEAQKAADPDRAVMNEWINRVGYSADIPGLARDFPEVGWQSYETWARGQDWRAILK